MNRKVQIGISAVAAGAGGLLASIFLLQLSAEQVSRDGFDGFSGDALAPVACLIALLSGLVVLLEAWDRSDPS